MGAGIFGSTKATIIIQDSALGGLDEADANEANDGGGIFSFGSLSLKGKTTLERNSAKGNGGGIFLIKALLTVEDDSRILNNHADSDSNGRGRGGGVFVTGAEDAIKVLSGDIFDNTPDDVAYEKQTNLYNQCR